MGWYERRAFLYNGYALVWAVRVRVCIGGPGRVDEAGQGEEPVAQRRCALWRASVPLRLHGARLLHGSLRRFSRDRRPFSAVLGPRARPAA